MTDEKCPDRRKDGQQICRQVEDLSIRVGNLEAADKAAADSLAEILDILRLGKSFFRLAGYFGTGVKWVAGVVAGIAAIYYAFKGGS